MQSRIRLLRVSCVLVLACVATVADGQQRRGAFRGINDLIVAAAPAVAERLSLTDEQTALAKKLDAENRQHRQELFDGAGDLSRAERRERFREYSEQRQQKVKQLADSLGAEKAKRTGKSDCKLEA